MKGYFIHFNARDTAGVSAKIDMQLKEFAKYFDIQEINIKLSQKGIIRNALSILPYVSLAWDYTEAYNKIERPDFLYIRKVGGDYKHYRFLKYIKKQFPSCKILIEIPTYPYYKEGLRNIKGVLIVKDYYNYLFKMPKYIDRIVTYAEDETIFGVPTLRIMNGIDVQSVDPIDFSGQHHPDRINMIAVSYMQPHHGYERVIEGLHQYYDNHGKCDYHIHMVGDGTDRVKYENMIHKYGLESHFTFYGMQSGKNLHEIYCQMDLALSSFGWYKDGISKSSALKVREYLAKGLPVVSGCREDAFDGTNGEYGEIFPNDVSPIDFERIDSFYERIYKGHDRRWVIENVREFAKDHVDNSVTMKPIVDYIAEKKYDKK